MARTLDPPITVIVDADDDLARLEHLRRLHARPYGQILCEPDPTATSAELARYVLEALGKHSQPGTRGQLWTQVDSHLRTEHVRELALVRAHTLSYSALRDLAAHTHNADVALWLLATGDPPTAAIRQLLEARPHQTGSIDQLIKRWTTVEPAADPHPPPLGAGPDYPYLTPIRSPYPTSRTRLCAKLTGREKQTVTATWTAAQDWMLDWLDARDEGTVGEMATAVYTLAAAGDTGSEILARVQAALNAIHRDGITINRDLFDGDLLLQIPETRPYEYGPAVKRAASMIDTIADPQLAAILALSIVFRQPRNVSRINLDGIGSDGSYAFSDYGGVHAIPPPLRPAVIAPRDQQLRAGTDPHRPLFPGQTHGRLSRLSIERQLSALDLPRSLWDGTADDYFDGPDLDGRRILDRITASTLIQPKR